VESFILIGVSLLFFIGAVALFIWSLDRRAGPGVLAATGILAAVAFLTLLGSFFVHPIPAGYVGVVTSFGKVQPETLKPGLNFVAPIVNSVTAVDTRVRGIPFGADDPNTQVVERFGAASREYQDVWLQGTLNVHVDQQKAVDLYQNVGLDYDTKLVMPFFATAIKEVVPQYAIGDVLANREKIRQQAVDKLQSKLASYGLIVDDVAIANIDFSEQYKAAIEAKQVAEQQVQTETQILRQREIQADQARAVAQGAADAAVINATGQSEANRLLQQSLSDELIRYTLIQKLGPSINTIILPDGQSFILDPKALTPPSNP
jgi:regulator of protease activity HflC (stomatin/prohibitin superfamily)